MYNINQLLTFVKVAELKSFNKASTVYLEYLLLCGQRITIKNAKQVRELWI